MNAKRLETQLISGWQRLHDQNPKFRRDWLAILAIYADSLLVASDVRGELIALDLGGAAADSRRSQLTVEWLGETVAIGSRAKAKYGLLEVSFAQGEMDQICAFFDTPASQYVSHINVTGSAEDIEACARCIAMSPRQWLRSVRITSLSSYDANATVLGRDVISGLIVKTPSLHTLEIRGHRIMEAFPHPTVRRLILSGHDSILTSQHPLPAVYEIDFAILAPGDPLASEINETPFALLSRQLFPALRKLKLHRNEPGNSWPTNLGGNCDMFPALDDTEFLAYLTHIWLPAVRSQEQVAFAQRLLNRMRFLEEVSISKTESISMELTHKTAVVNVRVI